MSSIVVRRYNGDILTRPAIFAGNLRTHDDDPDQADRCSITPPPRTAGRSRSRSKSSASPTTLIPISISRGEQFTPEFLAIAPNNKIPAIVDPEGPDGKPISIFESGAILKYLAEKFGALYGKTPRERVKIDEWLFWQVGGFGPILGQTNHFAHYAPEKVPYAITRFTNESHRLYRVSTASSSGWRRRARTTSRATSRSPTAPSSTGPTATCATPST